MSASRKARVGVADLDAPAPGTCPACGSGACARTGLPWCRHTNQPRDPDPVAAALLADRRLPIRIVTRSAA